MFKFVRIAILLIVLASVWGTYNTQKNVTRDWQGVLSISIIPVIADDKAKTKSFVANIKPKRFDEIAKYLKTNARRFGRNLESSIDIRLEPTIDNAPPDRPAPNASVLSRMFWSLQLRWWAWNNQPKDNSDDRIRLYVLYQSPDRRTALPHSTGLQNGLIGLIYARAESADRRLHNVIITHELLHTFGASDKYDLRTGQPVFPQGYADPDRTPVVPQQFAEIMGRGIPVSSNQHVVATRLSKTRVGKLTASEIGWLDE